MWCFTEDPEQVCVS